MYNIKNFNVSKENILEKNHVLYPIIFLIVPGLGVQQDSGVLKNVMGCAKPENNKIQIQILMFEKKIFQRETV